MKVILASQSKGRKFLLKKMGIPFQTVIPAIDEEAFLKEKSLTPQALCLKIAQAKGEKVAKNHPEALIIASDQLAHFENQFYGKAHTKEKAIKTLLQLQGKTHSLINGLYMKYKHQIFCHSSVNEMSLRPLSLKQITNYVNQEQPLKSAGCYHIDQMGLGLFEKIKSEDFSSIIGLPIMTVINQLIEWGYPYLEDKDF